MLKMFINIQVIVIVFFGFLHLTTSDESRNIIKGKKHQLSLESFIGGEQIFSKELISKIEEFIAPTLNNTTNDLCRNHSDIYIDGLRHGETWAYQMLDSSAKLQSGVLMGNFISMGNFDECIEVKNVKTDLIPFNGKHCLATLKWENSSFVSTSIFFKNMSMPGVLNSVTLQWGFCIPSTCGAQDLETGLSNLLNRDIIVSVTDLNCHTGEQKKLKTIDCVAIAVILVFGCVVIFSTAYDFLKKGQRKDILLAFSLYTNGKKLLNTEMSADALPSLHGIRVLSICWIVIGHRYMISTGGPAMNLIFANKFIKSWDSTFVVNNALAVDTFLLMSGLLLVYVFLKQMEKRQKKFFNVPLYYLHRYIRLTPALAVLVLLQLSLIEHMGSGPLWDTNNSFLVQLCKENWWSALLHVQNYVSGDRMCVGHSWYLSVDMQLVWASPLILIPSLKWRRKWTILLLGSLIIAGIAVPFTVTYVNEFPAGIRAGVGPKWAARNKYEYVTTHTRFTPWLIGFGLGYLLYHSRNKKIKLSKLQVFAGWLTASVALISPVYAILPFQQPDYSYNVLESAFYISLHRPVWSFAVGWVIFACVSGYGGPVNKFLSWKVFQPFSRLTYCIYLVHFTFILYQNFATRTPMYLNNMNVVTLFFSDMVFSILLAAPLFLVFEIPAMNIEKVLFNIGGAKRKREEASSSVTANKSVEAGRINQAFTVHSNDNSKLNNR